MKYLKFFGLVTRFQIALFVVLIIYYSFAGLPDVNPSSPIYLYYWPLVFFNSGPGHGGEGFVGPIVLLGYSILALAIYSIVNILRYFLTRKY